MDFFFPDVPQQVGIELKRNFWAHFGQYGGLKLEYFGVVKSKVKQNHPSTPLSMDLEFIVWLFTVVMSLS